MTVITYTIPTCRFCIKLKEWLKKNRIKYEDRDLAESQHQEFRDEVIEKSSQIAVPVIDVDGEIIIGFDEKKLTKLLKK